jgi:hypothetical protein
MRRDLRVTARHGNAAVRALCARVGGDAETRRLLEENTRLRVKHAGLRGELSQLREEGKKSPLSGDADAQGACDTATPQALQQKNHKAL